MSRVYCTFRCGVRRQRSSVPLRFQPTALELTKYAAGITVPKNPTNNAMDTNQKRLCFIACTGMNGVSFFKMVSTVRRVRQRPMPTTVVTKLVQAMILAGVGIGSGIKRSSRARGWYSATHFNVCFTPTALIIGGTIWENTAAPKMERLIVNIERSSPGPLLPTCRTPHR